MTKESALRALKILDTISEKVQATGTIHNQRQSAVDELLMFIQIANIEKDKEVEQAKEDNSKEVE